MAKQDTINKYIDEYLAGRTPAAIEKFRSKDIDRQYQSIMTWRYNQRKKGETSQQAASEPAVKTDTTAVESLRALRRTLERRKDITEGELDEITGELTSLADFVKAERHRLRLAEIQKLESSSREIAERLRVLRDQVRDNDAPSLFD